MVRAMKAAASAAEGHPAAPSWENDYSWAFMNGVWFRKTKHWFYIQCRVNHGHAAQPKTRSRAMKASRPRAAPMKASKIKKAMKTHKAPKAKRKAP